MTIYTVKYEDERLDTVVYNHYGNLDNVFAVLEANPHIQKDVFLDVGVEIKLPYFETVAEEKEIQLWD